MLRSHCLKVSGRKCFFRGLMALGLLVGFTGHAKAQPTYAFTTLDRPGSSSLPIQDGDRHICSGSFGGNSLSREP
jgi:hypothetical protein